MHKPVKYVEKGLTYAAGGAWFFYNKWNQIAQRPSFTPRPALHPVWRRCSSLEYSRYARSSRLATRAHRRPRCTRISNSEH